MNIEKLPKEFRDWYEAKTCPTTLANLQLESETFVYALWENWKDGLRDKQRIIQKSLEVFFPWAESIKGTAYSDDKRVNITFDATPWFRSAAKAWDIECLVESGWGVCCVADDVLGHIHTQKPNQDIKDLYTYCAVGDMGYQVMIDGEAALEYLQLNNPVVIVMLKEKNLL